MSDQPVITPDPNDQFHMISLGDRVLFCGHSARFTADQIAAEIAYWKKLLGEAAVYQLVDAGTDLSFTEIVIAIYNLHPRGIGVRQQHLLDLGYAPSAVTKHFGAAKEAVIAAGLEAAPTDTSKDLPANVVRFTGRRVKP